MSFEWSLRAVLAERCGIDSATALKARLEKHAGIALSLQSVSVLLNSSPDAIRFRTIQAVCTATGLKLSDFCEVIPDLPSECIAAKPLYQNSTAGSKLKNEFPSPRAFYGRKTFGGYRYR